MDRYEEVRCTYEDDNFWYVDAWKPGQEEGEVIAYIDAITARVLYNTPEARIDNVAQEVINSKRKEVLERIKERMKTNLPDFIPPLDDSDYPQTFDIGFINPTITNYQGSGIANDETELTAENIDDLIDLYKEFCIENCFSADSVCYVEIKKGD